MNTLDWIILVLIAVAFVVGLFKGFFRQILTILGVIVVATLTAVVEPYVQNWFVNTSMDAGIRNTVSTIATVLLIAVVYAVLALLLTRLLKKVKIVGVLDRILGAVLSLGVVYFAFAVIFALIQDTGEGFLQLTKSVLGETFETSWFGNVIYGNNFFGDWIIKGVAGKILEGLDQTAEPAVAAILSVCFA